MYMCECGAREMMFEFFMYGKTHSKLEIKPLILSRRFSWSSCAWRFATPLFCDCNSLILLACWLHAKSDRGRSTAHIVHKWLGIGDCLAGVRVVRRRLWAYDTEHMIYGARKKRTLHNEMTPKRGHCLPYTNDVHVCLTVPTNNAQQQLHQAGIDHISFLAADKDNKIPKTKRTVKKYYMQSTDTAPCNLWAFVFVLRIAFLRSNELFERWYVC